MNNSHSIEPGMPKEEILQNIIGYSTKITTPFGEKCSVYADHTATGRPFRMIEDLVQQKIKPMIANSHTETSLMGYFSTQLLHYAEVSILNSFKVSKATHFSVPTGNGATGAFERLSNILRVSEIAKHELSINPSIEKIQNKNIPFVYITPYEHHSNILPWQVSGCNLLSVEGDKYGNMNLDVLQKELKKNAHFKTQIVSVSATSNVTSQRTDLQKLNSIIKSFKESVLQPGQKFIFIVDCAAFCSHNRLDLSQNGLSEIDFICISPHKHLGGSESTGVLIAKLSAYDSTLPPSFPGGGTVKAVVGLNQEHTWYDNDPTSREMPGTPNAIGFYRAALTFELQDHIGINYILHKEEQNAKYFFEQIQKLNEDIIMKNQIPPRKIKIYGDPDIETRYDVFSFNVYGPGSNTDAQGKSLFHPNFVARVLNDVFGIQVRSGCSCAGPYGVLLLEIPQKKAIEIVGDMLQGYEDVKPGWVRLDTFFTLEQYELDYIIEAIKLIALYGEKIMRFYQQNPQTAQFHLRQQSHPTFDFSLFGLGKENIQEFSIEERPKQLTTQMVIGRSLLENPESYIRDNYPEISQGFQLSKISNDSHSDPSIKSQILDQSRISTNSSTKKKSPKITSVKPNVLDSNNMTNSEIQKLISIQVQQQLQTIFSNQNSNNTIRRMNSRSLVRNYIKEEKLLFESYSNTASGVDGINQTGALQLAQDYNLFNQMSVQQLTSIFKSVSDKHIQQRPQSPLPLTFDQFHSFLEKVALVVYDGSSDYLTISSKFDAFFREIIIPQQQINKNNNNQVNWSKKQIATPQPEQSQQYQDNFSLSKTALNQEKGGPQNYFFPRKNISSMKNSNLSQMNNSTSTGIFKHRKVHQSSQYPLFTETANENISSKQMSQTIRRAEKVYKSSNSEYSNIYSLLNSNKQ